VERVPRSRVWSIFATNSDSVASWARAIRFRSLQKVSSRLTLVLCPSIVMERLTIEDFIRGPHSPLASNIIYKNGMRQKVKNPGAHAATVTCMMPAWLDTSISSGDTLTRSRFFLLAFESQPLQLLSATANPLQLFVIICRCFSGVIFSMLATFEDALCAGTICVFLYRSKLAAPLVCSPEFCPTPAAKERPFMSHSCCMELPGDFGNR
jgi:hypothetical protein